MKRREVGDIIFLKKDFCHGTEKGCGPYWVYFVEVDGYFYGTDYEERVYYHVVDSDGDILHMHEGYLQRSRRWKATT